MLCTKLFINVCFRFIYTFNFDEKIVDVVLNTGFLAYIFLAEGIKTRAVYRLSKLLLICFEDDL